MNDKVKAGQTVRTAGPVELNQMDEVSGHNYASLSNDIRELKAIVNVLQPKPQETNRADLYAALATAQGAIKAAEMNQEAEVRNKEGKFLYTFKYADLAACLDVIRKPLSDNGLALIQIPSLGENNAVHMKTVIGHESGQHISCNMTMYPEKAGPQAIGTCMAYLRRYSLCAMIGVAQFDDDAALSSEGDPLSYERITAEEAEKIAVTAHNLFGKDDDAVVARMLKAVFNTSELPIAAVPDLPAGCAEQAINALTNKAKTEADEAKKKEK